MRSSRTYEGDLEVLPPEWPAGTEPEGEELSEFAEIAEMIGHAWGRCAVRTRPIRRRLRSIREQAQAACDWCMRPARRTRNWYSVAIGVHRGFNARHQSSVQRRLKVSPADVVELIGAGRIARCGDPHGPTLSIEPALSEHVAVDHAHCVSARLHIPWSYPDLPMSLSVIDWSADLCVLDLSLRSRRRFRYPLRYYDASHRALAELASEIDRRLSS